MAIAFVLGTRPEVIKLAPVIHELRKRGQRCVLIHTGQHADMAAGLYRFFNLQPDCDLQAMQEKPDLSGLSTTILQRLERFASTESLSWVVVQGDTTSAVMGAYWAFCRRVPVAHVEAGLRTYDLDSPFPEEGNRQMISRIATLHFAPTAGAGAQLRREGISPERVHVVGNTSIDALYATLRLAQERVAQHGEGLHPTVENFMHGARVVLVTAHRRENAGRPLASICRAVRRLADLREDVRVVFPVHPNPSILSTVRRVLENHPQIMLCPPQGYAGFARLMAAADVILTDSGGVQEEAPALGKRILVLRECTERPEGVEAGFARLVGSNENLIVAEALEALEVGKAFTLAQNPYGDGHAAERIAYHLMGFGQERVAEVDRAPVSPRMAQ